ncbi:hypothetical protein HK099_004418 [Clydaea vesicula]|uniref:Aquaporin n=1 Tax=Clydaea vesicula TaxID=447962 RepID=A0AAD5UAN1_9FUNG|nr:hypothetical protein HK099_004418 [Clydaea vesicula]KAJ3397633.1 hypothetical protein HDU92_005375 [Lobulomyces angularis]
MKTYPKEIKNATPSFLQSVFAEGLVTFLFLFTVMAFSINNVRQGTPENLVLAAIGVTLSSTAFIYSFGDVSGANFNPAVTVGLVLNGKMPLLKGIAYVTVQLIAAVMATLHVQAVFPNNPLGDHTSIFDALLVQPNAQSDLLTFFLMEASLTFILLYVIFSTAVDKVENVDAILVNDGDKSFTVYTTIPASKNTFAPIAIGFTLGFLCLLGGSTSGGCFNPARAFGPALLSGNFDNFWVYAAADVTGAVLAGITQSSFALGSKVSAAKSS